MWCPYVYQLYNLIYLIITLADHIVVYNTKKYIVIDASYTDTLLFFCRVSLSLICFRWTTLKNHHNRVSLYIRRDKTKASLLVDDGPKTQCVDNYLIASQTPKNDVQVEDSHTTQPPIRYLEARAISIVSDKHILDVRQNLVSEITN